MTFTKAFLLGCAVALIGVVLVSAFAAAVAVIA